MEPENWLIADLQYLIIAIFLVPIEHSISKWKNIV